MSTKPIRREHWPDDTSIKVDIRTPDPSKREENQKVMKACEGEYDGVKLRLALGAYGPGTVQKPTPRIWWLLGEAMTIVCRDARIAEWFIGELKTWVKQFDGVVLEEK